jgi:hypothetical protein
MIKYWGAAPAAPQSYVEEGSTVNAMADHETLEHLKKQIVHLSPQEQLQLVSFIVARLRAVLPPVPARAALETPEGAGPHELSDEAAELWE